MSRQFTNLKQASKQTNEQTNKPSPSDVINLIVKNRNFEKAAFLNF